MKESLTKLKIDNFKSLKDFEISLNQFNVLIGPNGSGKTNVLESFKLAVLCMSPQRAPAYPFADWGGYRNIVWSGNEHEPISFRIGYSIDGYDVDYSSTIAGPNNNRLDILEEGLCIKDYLDMTLKLDGVHYDVNQSFMSSIDSPDDNNKIADVLKSHFVVPHPSSSVSIMRSAYWGQSVMNRENFVVLRSDMTVGDTKKGNLLASPRLKERKHNHDSLYAAALDYLTDENSIIMLKQLDYNDLRHSVPINYYEDLGEDGDGLINLLYQWYVKNHQLPEGITLALEALFPNWQVSFQVIPGSDVIMTVHDGRTELAPASIPDGFYKLLAILAAVELGPKILLIDEIENSLHGRIIEYVVDLLRTIGSTVIVTTHSPLVIDYVDVANLVILEQSGSGTTCHRVKDPDRLREDLADKGITPSESWLYGDLR